RLRGRTRQRRPNAAAQRREHQRRRHPSPAISPAEAVEGRLRATLNMRENPSATLVGQPPTDSTAIARSPLGRDRAPAIELVGRGLRLLLLANSAGVVFADE